MYDRAVSSGKPSIGYLGQIYDPYFGTTTADFVTQLRLLPAWDDADFTIDSMKLYLHLLQVKGGAGVPHRIKLSEINEMLYTDSTYFSTKTVPLSGYVIDDIELPALRADTINDISIKIPVDFGRYLTRDTAKLFHSNSKPDFRTFFKGLYVQMYPSSDPLLVSLYLEPPSASSTVHSESQNHFTLYMHNNLNVTKVTFFVLDAVNRNASFNRFSHDFSTAETGKKIEHIDSLFIESNHYRDTLSFLQYLNGVYTKIVFPGLKALKNDPAFNKISVNKAQLTIPAYFDGDLYTKSTVTSSLRLRYKTKSGYKYEVPDYAIESTYHSFFNGHLDTAANVYNFNIPSFVQGYLEDATDEVEPELEIFQGDGTSNVILKANNSSTPVKFVFTYTLF